MEVNKNYGIVGLISLLVASIGGTMYLTPDQLNKSYICTTTHEVGLFDRLSSTSKTAYWMEGSTEMSKTCRNGVWQKLKDYAQQNNLEINVLLNRAIFGGIGIQYLCDQTKCEVIN